MSDLAKVLAETQAYEELRSAHNRALRALSKREADQAELTEAIYRAAKDAALGMKIPPVPTPKASGKTGSPETLTVLLGDWQLGKNSETYNIEVAKQRIDLLAKKIARLIELHGVPVNEIQCALLGDFVESDGNIFPSQAYEVEQGGLYVQIFEGAAMLAQFVRAMAALAPKVTVRGAIGNHGRLGRFGDHSNESNADAILYRVAKDLVKTEKRINWKESLTMGGRHWYDTLEMPNGKTAMHSGAAHLGCRITQSPSAHRVGTSACNHLISCFTDIGTHQRGWCLAMERIRYGATPASNRPIATPKNGWLLLARPLNGQSSLANTDRRRSIWCGSMVTVAKRREPDFCDVCEEQSAKLYGFGGVVLGLDIRTGDQILTEHKICVACLAVLIELVMNDQLPQ